MVPSAGSPRTVIVKRRGSKRHVAEGEDWDSSRPGGCDPARSADDPSPTLPAASSCRLRHSRRVSSPAPAPAVVIVGGGISGLAAAFFLRDRGVAVTVLEGSPRLGGKLAVSEIAGIAVDEGAEALLARRPEGTDLIGAVGLAGQLVPPGTTAASDLDPGPPAPAAEAPVHGRARPTWTSWRARGSCPRRDWPGPATTSGSPPTTRDGDVAVASYVGARFGRELVDRLVDPLLGGVYAGRSQELSFEATLGGLAQAARQHRSLAEAAASLLPAPGGPPPAPAGLHHAVRRPRHAAGRGGGRVRARPCGPAR